MEDTDLVKAKAAVVQATQYLRDNDPHAAHMCCDAARLLLEKTPRELWSDEHYRLSSKAHIGSTSFYLSLNDRNAVREGYRLAISDGKKIKKADFYCIAYLKLLWKMLGEFSEKEKAQAKGYFVELCNVVDEITDVEALRQNDPELDDILKRYLSFAQSHPAKQEPFVKSDRWEKLQKLFLDACKQKLWENAELFFTKMVTEHLNVDLSSPYEAVDQSDAKLSLLLQLLTHLGMEYWRHNQKDKAFLFLEKATRFILMKQHVSDQLWRHSAVSAYICALYYCEKNNFLHSINACKRSLSMFDCIREKNPEDMDCIVKAQETLAKSLHHVVQVEAIKAPAKKAFIAPKKSLNGSSVPKALPAKPEVSLNLAQQRALFDQALKDGDREAARTWWNKHTNKSADDWRVYLSLLREISTLYFEQDKFAECISIITDILNAHENIKNQEEELDIILLMESCDLAGVCCADMNNDEENRQWSQRADAYRLALMAEIKKELQRFLIACDLDSKQEDWEFVQSTVYDAERSLDRFRELMSDLVFHEDASLEEYLDQQTFMFASRLYRVFEGYRTKRNFVEAEAVISEMNKWFRKMKVLSDDAELLRIESKVQLKAFDFKNNKKCKMRVALELARRSMPEEDAKKKTEIEERRKVQEDAVKAERKRQHLEAFHERERQHEEERLKAAEKEAEDRKQAERNKQYEIEKAKFVGFYRKFKHLSFKEVKAIHRHHRKLSSKIMNLSNKHYVEGCAHDLARQKLILACEAVMEACDVILSCYLKSQLTDHKDVSYEELLQLNPVFIRAWNLFNKSEEWERLVQALRECATEFRCLHVLRKRVPRAIVHQLEGVEPPVASFATRALSEMPSPVKIKQYRVEYAQETCVESAEAKTVEAVPPENPSVATFAECVPVSPTIPVGYFFPVKNKPKNGFRNGLSHSLGHFLCEVSRYEINSPETDNIEKLIQRCEENFIHLVGFQIYRNTQGCLLSEEALGNIAYQLFKRCPELIDILDDRSDPLWRFMNMLETCRIDPVGISRWEILSDEINALIPQGESASEYAHRMGKLLRNRIEEIACDKKVVRPY